MLFDFLPRGEYTNVYGIVHGGIHVALVDAALTAATGSRLTLLSLDVHYHRPILLNKEPVSITATLLHRGRRTALAEAAVTDPSGKILTTARGSFG